MRFTAYRPLAGALLFALLSAFGAPARAGYLIAVNGDGTAIFTGADNRVVYQHDPKTLKVIDRIRFDQPIKGLAINREGTLLFVADGVFDSKLTIREVKTGKTVRTIEGVSALHDNQANVLASSIVADLLVYHSKQSLHVISMQDGTEVKEIKDPDPAPFLVAISPDGKTLGVISRAVPNGLKDEIPADKKNDNTYKLMHGDKGSMVFRYEIKSGEQTGKVQVRYPADAQFQAIAGFSGPDLIVLTYSGVNARIAPDGATALFKVSPMGTGYGTAISPDGKRFAAGSMIDSGALLEAGQDKAQPINGAKPTPGWPEYYGNMVFDGQGNLYGVTSGLRIFRVTDKLEMTPIEAVY